MTHSAHARDTRDHRKQENTGPYARLGVMTVLSFIAMYILMYAMVDSMESVFMNVNQVYMAGLMAAPMVIIELALMRQMYSNRRLNMALLLTASLLGVFFFIGIRRQAAVGDRQFLRSMIPHHSGAILMCQQASISDSEIRRLCDGIMASQRQEIDQMKAMLSRAAR